MGSRHAAVYIVLFCSAIHNEMMRTLMFLHAIVLVLTTDCIEFVDWHVPACSSQPCTIEIAFMQQCCTQGISASCVSFVDCSNVITCFTCYDFFGHLCILTGQELQQMPTLLDRAALAYCIACF